MSGAYTVIEKTAELGQMSRLKFFCFPRVEDDRCDLFVTLESVLGVSCVFWSKLMAVLF